MTAQRHYAYATVFNIPIYNMRNLWEPSREFQGKPVQTPNYLAGFLVPRTQQFWYHEPAFQDVVRAATELCGKYGITTDQLEWPFRDGNIPEPGKAPVEYMKNHWVFTGTSTSPISVNMAMNGQVQPLTNRAIVKPGDLVVASISLAISTQNSRKAKIYCNSVLFTNPGEEIAVGNSVTGTQLMEMAKAQGLNITGFQTAGAGFGGAPAGGGFAAPQAAQPGGFGAGNPAPHQFGGAPQSGFGTAGAPSSAGPAAPAAPAFAGAPNGASAAGGGFTAPAPMQPGQIGGGGFGGGGAPVGGAGAPAFNGAPAGGGFAPPQPGGFAPPQGGGFGGPR